jgi:hypothetical protein
MVTMADGSLKPIDRIVAGDLVRGGAGGANRVLAVHRTLLGARPLYALNDETAHFVTGSQPLVADQGDVTIDHILGMSPAGEDESHNLLAGRERNSFVRLARQKLGAAPASLDMHEVLHTIRGVRAASDTQLFHLGVDGDGSYVVENYRARIKYS